MRESTYGMLCSIVLGLGHMCMFMGYDTQSLIMEPVLRSVHDRNPSSIDAHAGYNGQAVIYLMYTVSNVIAPWILSLLGSKMTVFAGSLCFTIFLCSYFYVHYIPFYGTAALLGLGFSLYYMGNGAYLTEHSTRKTIERNSALSWAIGCSCMIVGGVVMLFTIQQPPEEILDSTNGTVSSNATFSSVSYREYSADEIRLMYGAFVGVTLISNILFALLPSRRVQGSVADIGTKNYERVKFVKQIKKFFSSLIDKRMLMFAPTCCLVGSATCFWVTVYPTTFIFTKRMSGFIYLPAYYSIVLGAADMAMGFIISALSLKVKNFGQMPTQTIGVVLQLAGVTLALLSSPPWSTNTPNDEPAPLIEPNVYLSLVIGLLFGLSDNCLNTSRTVLAALVIPGKRSQVFTISKFYQSIIFAAMLFLSPFMSMPMHFGLITVNCFASLICCYFVSKSTRQLERTMNDDMDRIVTISSPKTKQKNLTEA